MTLIPSNRGQQKVEKEASRLFDMCSIGNLLCRSTYRIGLIKLLQIQPATTSLECLSL